jgi:hypothetical protein
MTGGRFLAECNLDYYPDDAATAEPESETPAATAPLIEVAASHWDGYVLAEWVSYLRRYGDRD